MKILIRWVLKLFTRPFLIRASYLLMILFKPFLRGRNVECPICGSTFRKFLPYGVRSRENVLCPTCLSLERHRLIWLYLVRETDFLSEKRRMLHLAPEQCFLKRFRNLPNLDYLTGDLESPIAEYHFDLHKIPFDSGSFDLILCNHVLEHVRDDRRVMSEIRRVLRPGGLAILQVPVNHDLTETFEDPSITSPREREKYFGQKDHVRKYGADYPDRLRQAGFDVDPWPVAVRFTPDDISRYRLDAREILYLASNPG